MGYNTKHFDHDDHYDTKSTDELVNIVKEPCSYIVKESND